MMYFILAINFKIPTVVGILKFMTGTNFMLSELLFALILYIPVNIFQSCRDGYYWVEPVLSSG